MQTLKSILMRPRTVLTMMVVMVLSGVFTYITIPKEADPDIDVPVFYVSILHHGISPEDAERLLVKPMETELRGLDGLKEITAIASEGHAGIIVEFNIDVDQVQASSDVREKVDQARAELPTEAEEPVVNELNMSLFPVLVVSLSGDVPERTLFTHAKKLQDEIEAIPSVLEARLTGGKNGPKQNLAESSDARGGGAKKLFSVQTRIITARPRNASLVLRGRTEADAKVSIMAETSGVVQQTPVIKGSFVKFRFTHLANRHRLENVDESDGDGNKDCDPVSAQAAE